MEREPTLSSPHPPPISPVGGCGLIESSGEGERSAVASEGHLGLASWGGYRDRVPRCGPWVSRRGPMLTAILVIASLIAMIPLIARSPPADDSFPGSSTSYSISTVLRVIDHSRHGG